MRTSQVRSVERRLVKFVEVFSEVLGGYHRKRCCVTYLCGLLLNGERKSIEPMAERMPKDNAQALQQFVSDSPWSYGSLQLGLIVFMEQVLRPTASRSALILDDTSFPKQGKASVGVARQYCGALGKIANCQVMVSWHYAEGGPRQLHLPLISQLFLPER